ncbi:uncharacterized protein LOC125226507 [Leguminivora glycinivorella]|uniref:uncharacterized protein LOC125226507 n=1 Tax=Leguminivora glycinivorella TaxID=1035111 RepID=UPI00200BFD38|nr:uncharacterized protein LOC125226507 [Leguminivora glycinivorella]
MSSPKNTFERAESPAPRVGPSEPAPQPAAATAGVLGVESEYYRLQTYDSDTSEKSAASSNYITMRQKRKREHDELSDLRNEMRGLMNSLRSLTTTVNEIKEMTTELRTSVQFMSDKYDGVMDKLHVLEVERSKDRRYIAELEDKMEGLERRNRMSGIEIRNIPKLDTADGKKIETKKQLLDIVKNIGQTLNIEIQEVDIRDTYRINSAKGDTKPLIVDFNSVIMKEHILEAVKTFNKSKPKGDKLNTSHLEIIGPARPIYVSETLTPKNQKLFYMAREFARDNGYAHRWTSKGLVYFRKAEGERPIRIENETDFSKLLESN